MRTALNDDIAQSIASQSSSLQEGRHPKEGLTIFVHHITNLAEEWTKARIAHLDAIQGPIGNRDTRVFDYHLIRTLAKAASHEELRVVLEACVDQRGLHFQRE